MDHKEIEKKDDLFHILYTTFILIAVLVLLWGLLIIFNQNNPTDEIITITEEE